MENVDIDSQRIQPRSSLACFCSTAAFIWRRFVSGELAIRHATEADPRSDHTGSGTQRHHQSLVEQGFGTDQSNKAEHG